MSEQPQKKEVEVEVLITSPPPAPETSVLSEDECKKCKEHVVYIGSRIVTTCIVHPIAFARTLIQLGHEPYPMTRGKAYFVGRETNYLPNILKYISNIYHSHGFATIYSGVGADVIQTVTSGVGCFAFTMYLGHCYPEIGGAEDLLDEKKEDLDAYQALRLKVREAVRSSIVQLAGVVISRPFAVIMVRQIAQHIGQEAKYTPINPLQPLLRIGAEEGPAGLFSGILPAAIGTLISVWGVVTLSYGVDRALKYIEDQQNVQDDEVREVIKSSHKVLDMVVNLGTNNLRYPFEVVSTVMAVTGSGLLVSLLPYSPNYEHWTDAYAYLKPYDIYRGAKMFWREERASIRIGQDNQVYASKKHFI